MNTDSNPYPGLRAFEYKENHLFFGREGKAQEIAERLEKNHFVAVVGTSGSGKSSLVRAGLLPLVYGGRMFSTANWKVSVMRPGGKPIRNLAESLVDPEEFDISEFFEDSDTDNEAKTLHSNNEARIAVVETILRRSGVGLLDFVEDAEFEDDENLLVVVDQFEELFRFKNKGQTGYADEAAAFVKLLLEATSAKKNKSREEKKQIFIVMTMRSDFLGNCAEFRDLPEAINAGQYLIPRMKRDQLRSSIESPAKVFRAEVSPALVGHLLNNLEDTRDQSLEVRERMLQDQLPVLQHALMRTWKEWESRNTPNEPLDTKHYRAIGGMKEALSKHANEAYDELDEKQKKIAEKMFKCLTEKDEEHRETRRPSTIKEISSVAETSAENVIAVIEVFRKEGRTFLMPPPSVELKENTKIDISHESLIRVWDRLREWVKEESENGGSYRRLSEDTNKWIYEKERNKRFLWTGGKIEDAYNWWKDFNPNLVWAERYQTLTDREKLRLAEISQSSPNEVSAKREGLYEERFREAEEFLVESHKQEKRKRIRLVATLGSLATVFFLLFGATAYFAYNVVMTGRDLKEKEQELIAKNVSLREEQKKVKEINKALKSSNEEQIKQREEAEKQRQQAQNERKNALTQKERADREASQAKTSEKKAQVSADKAKRAEAIAKDQAVKAKIAQEKAVNSAYRAMHEKERAEAMTERADAMTETLKLNRAGFINVENEYFDDAKSKFKEYLEKHNELCNNDNYESCGEKETIIGQWWGNHNIALTNWKLAKVKDDSEGLFYSAAKCRFKDALTALRYKDNNILESLNDENNCVEAEDSRVNFSPISFNGKRVEEMNDAEIKQGINITLWILAKFYRDFATESNLLNDAKYGVDDSKDNSLNPLNNLQKYKKSLDNLRINGLNKEAYKVYEALLERIISEKSESKAEIQKQFAETNIDLGDSAKKPLESKVYYETAKKFYDKAIRYHEDEDHNSEIIALKNELLKTHFRLDEFDKADVLANTIIKDKRKSLEKKYKDPLNALTDDDFASTYSMLSRSYRIGSAILVAEYREKIREVGSKYAGDSKEGQFLSFISAALNQGMVRISIPSDESLRQIYFQMLEEINRERRMPSIPSDESLKTIYNQVFGGVEGIDINKIKKLEAKADSFSAIARGFSYLNAKEDYVYISFFSGTIDAYIANNQFCEAEFLMNRFLKKANRDGYRLEVLHKIVQVYLRYNNEAKAEFYLEEYLRETRNLASKVLSDNDCSQSAESGKFLYKSLRVSSILLVFGKDKEAYRLIKKSQAFWKCATKENEKLKEGQSLFFGIYNQILLGFTLEKEKEQTLEERLKPYKEVRNLIAELQNLFLQNTTGESNLNSNTNMSNSKPERRSEPSRVYENFDIFLRLRMAYLYLENGKENQADEILCGEKKNGECTDLKLNPSAFLPTAFFEKYVQSIEKIVEYMKEKKEFDRALKYNQSAVNILNNIWEQRDEKFRDKKKGDVKFEINVSEYGQYTIEHDTAIFDGTEKFLTDYIGMLESLQDLERNKIKKEQTDKEIKKLEETLEKVKNNKKDKIEWKECKKEQKPESSNPVSSNEVGLNTFENVNNFV